MSPYVDDSICLIRDPLHARLLFHWLLSCHQRIGDKRLASSPLDIQGGNVALLH